MSSAGWNYSIQRDLNSDGVADADDDAESGDCLVAVVIPALIDNRSAAAADGAY